jgi:YidC/Oxa1 family membrane protein insertase
LLHFLALAAPHVMLVHAAAQAPVVASLVNPLSQLINFFALLASWGIDKLYALTHNYGWSMLLLSLGVSLLVLPLSFQAYKSMQEAQALAPYLKRLQQQYKNDRQKLAEAQMKLYREHGVNPLGGCLPMLAQYPFLIGVYQAIKLHDADFAKAGWLWIGSPLSHSVPGFLATSLFMPDHVLLILYAVSMYFSMRLTPTVSMDPQQAQMMKTQALIMPVMIYFLASIYHWSSAFILYWLGFNVCSMAERVWVMRMPSRIPKLAEETPATLAGYPRLCPHCNELLVVAKGSKCEKCQKKVRKLAPSDNGARAQANPAQANSAQANTAQGAAATSGGKPGSQGSKRVS